MPTNNQLEMHILLMLVLLKVKKLYQMLIHGKF